MIRIMTVVLALLAGSVFADEPGGCVMPPPWKEIKPGTYQLGKRIVVTDHIPVGLLPAFVKEMTEKEFKAWAITRNNAAYDDAKHRHDDYVLDRGPLTTMNLASSSASHNTRFGGGVGAGGYGGAGGYLGYQNTRGGGGINYPYGYYGGGGGGSGGSGGFGSGFTFQGNNISTTDSANSQSWVKTFPDLNDGGGGPVVLINPYCFDYWKQHTE